MVNTKNEETIKVLEGVNDKLYAELDYLAKAMKIMEGTRDHRAKAVEKYIIELRDMKGLQNGFGLVTFKNHKTGEKVQYKTSEYTHNDEIIAYEMKAMQGEMTKEIEFTEQELKEINKMLFDEYETRRPLILFLDMGLVDNKSVKAFAEETLSGHLI